MQKPIVSDRRSTVDHSVSRLFPDVTASLPSPPPEVLKRMQNVQLPQWPNRLAHVEEARYPSGTVASLVVSAMLFGAMVMIGVLQVVSTPSTQSPSLPETTRVIRPGSH